MVEKERLIHLQVGGTSQRLDRFLADAVPNMSRSRAQRLIREGRVTLAGVPAKPSATVIPGTRVVVRMPPSPSDEPIPQIIPLDVVYEDGDILVVNKPAGMVIHPAHGHREGTLVNALLARYPNLVVGDAGRPGIVHRLDRDTSGLIVVAKSRSALEYLRGQFRSRQVQKVYQALVHGQPPAPEGIVEAPVARDPRHRKRMAVVAGGRESRTRYRVVEELGDYSLLVVSPETGRTHQIRVHLAWLGVPVVGDRVYGPGQSARRTVTIMGLERQFLHAWRLSFEHPSGKGAIDLEAPLPPDLQKAINVLRG